ncbi:hypothetical protein EZV62_010872 [Acer yangbiense]|uniref:Protein kinase domain-containing protein n=1 Tax=Acer yangbiense TaxID=1000413 RepID=A0A5C7I4E9_9ROSI|nr:hypothetical protein EZV62_010872 [Acer yangbiense]
MGLWICLTFSAFPNLTTLNHNMNNQVGSIPAGIGNATKLTFLDLGSNNLTNPINPEIGNLSELQVLRLYNNSLTGQIPYQLSNLQKVWLLRIGANYLEDPDRNQGYVIFIYLWLDYNLSENVPSFVAECSKLKFLDLSGNLIIVSIPSLMKLQCLDLKTAGLNSSIPTELGFCANLTYLELSKNSLTGLEIGNTERLEELDLSLNELQGTLPGFVRKQSKWDHYRRTWGLLGTLPNVRAFQQAPEEAVAGNPDTCGEMAQGSVYEAVLPTGDIFAVKHLHSLEENEFSEEYQMKNLKSEMHTFSFAYIAKLDVITQQTKRSECR